MADEYKPPEKIALKKNLSSEHCSFEIDGEQFNREEIPPGLEGYVTDYASLVRRFKERAESVILDKSENLTLHYARHGDEVRGDYRTTKYELFHEN